VALAVEGEAEEVAVEVVVDSNILMGVDQAIIKDAVVLMVVVVEEEDQTSIIHQRCLMESNHYTVSAFITQEMAAAAMATHAGIDFIIGLSNVSLRSLEFLENWYLTKYDIVLNNLGNCIWLR
jgi:hypothetical protein